jgi:hypothetical protein
MMNMGHINGPSWGCHIGILVQTAENLRTYFAFGISTSPVSLNPET